MTIETSPKEPDDAIATNHDNAKSSAKDFYVVALGASAGGLKPLEIFFENLTPMPEVAFVVIQHLSPDFKSLMNEILGRRTQLQYFHCRGGDANSAQCHIPNTGWTRYGDSRPLSQSVSAKKRP